MCQKFLFKESLEGRVGSAPPGQLQIKYGPVTLMVTLEAGNFSPDPPKDKEGQGEQAVETEGRHEATRLETREPAEGRLLGFFPCL